MLIITKQPHENVTNQTNIMVKMFHYHSKLVSKVMLKDFP